MTRVRTEKKIETTRHTPTSPIIERVAVLSALSTSMRPTVCVPCDKEETGAEGDIKQMGPHQNTHANGTAHAPLSH